MRMVALAAALATAVTPALSMAASCGPQEIRDSSGKCVCEANHERDSQGQCVAAIPPGNVAGQPLPQMGHIPTGAIVVGGLVILAGIAIGVAAGGGDNDTVPTTSTTGTTPPPT